MTDYNAEDAFMQSLRAEANEAAQARDEYQPDAQPELGDGEEEYDPDVAQEEPSIDAQPIADTEENIAPPAAEAQPDTTATDAPPKPRKLGGFLLDDEDDEDDTPGVGGTPSQVNDAMGAIATPQQSVPQTPVNASSAPNVQIQTTAQEQAAPESVPADSHVAPTENGLTSTSLPPKPVAQVAPSAQAAAAAAPAQSTSLPRARLPQDRVGILEDRIKDDPRGDLDAWLVLIDEYTSKKKLQEARNVYDRFFEVFPTAAEKWAEYAKMEIDLDNFSRAETIFQNSVVKNPNIELWTVYLNYVRRRHNLNVDSTGQARKIVDQTFEVVLNAVGSDKDAGPLWREYLEFVKSAPGNVSGSGWQDQQKMDSVRKAYQRAVCVPNQETTTIWRQYHQFEMDLNKATVGSAINLLINTANVLQQGRKFLQEQSPSYMSAQSTITALQNRTRGLDRTTLPRLPPAPGFKGDTEYAQQVELWEAWLEYEKEDPLAFKDENDLEAYKDRVIYTYKQAVMALRFWPEVWYKAADFCFDNGRDEAGDDFLDRGIAANPESCLLGFKKADRIEQLTADEKGDDSLVSRGKKVREPYETVLDALYELHKKAGDRKNETIARLRENFAQQQAAEPKPETNGEDEEDEEQGNSGESAKDAHLKMQIDAVTKGTLVETKMLQQILSSAWIALMRAMRRVQGKGKTGKSKSESDVGGFRQILKDARTRGRITCDVYVANALLEHHCYKDAAAGRVFGVAFKLFPEDEKFCLEYLKYLTMIGDITNARAVFETMVNRLAQKPENVPKTKPLYQYFHEYESQYGELAQITNLEKRMADLFPEDPKLQLFSYRFAFRQFDPTAVRPIISPRAQQEPKPLSMLGMPPIDPPLNIQMDNSPRVPPNELSQGLPAKRAVAQDDSDNDSTRPSKIARGDSPLKGAAGRRLDQARRNMQTGTAPLPAPLPEKVPHATPLPWEINMILNRLPHANKYNGPPIPASTTMGLLQALPLPPNIESLPQYQQFPQGQQLQQPPPSVQHQPAYPPPMPQQYGGYPPPQQYGYGR